MNTCSPAACRLHTHTHTQPSFPRGRSGTARRAPQLQQQQHWFPSRGIRRCQYFGRDPKLFFASAPKSPGSRDNSAQRHTYIHTDTLYDYIIVYCTSHILNFLIIHFKTPVLLTGTASRVINYRQTRLNIKQQLTFGSMHILHRDLKKYPPATNVRATCTCHGDKH